MKRFLQAISLVVVATGFSMTIAACGKKDVKSCSEFNEKGAEKCNKAKENGKECKYNETTKVCAVAE